MARETRKKKNAEESESKKAKDCVVKLPSKKKNLAMQDPIKQEALKADDTHESNVDLAERKNIKLPPINNVLRSLDLMQYGPTENRKLHIKQLQNYFVGQSIKQLTGADYAGRFTRRITALDWHEKYPYVLASASKFGDIMLIYTGQKSASSQDAAVSFETKAELQGGGAGYSITAMKFHQQETSILYRVSIDCTVAKVNLISGETTQFYDTGDYNRWFCGMDINPHRTMLIAGDNKGMAYKFSLEGNLLSKWKLHKNKIHHMEFSKKDPNLLVTSTLEKSEAVRIWDVRFLKESNDTVTSLITLPHACGLNCAKFSPSNGSRLLTSDQRDEIRVYEGPLWVDYLTIKHHHKQFQHITPIKADWHPVNDYVVIGRYPPKATNEARAIEFYDSYSGEQVDMIYPPLNEICSLNVFNPTGEYLATGMNSKLILWKPGLPLDVPENVKPNVGKSVKISDETRNALRGRRGREYSPTSDDDNEDRGSANKKKSKTTATANKNDGNKSKSGRSNKNKK